MRRMLVLFSITILCAPSRLNAQVTAIKAGRLVDPDTGSVVRDRVIVIEGSRIKAVGPGLAIPAGARIIDLSDVVVLPGLFDAHTHLCLSTDRPRDNGNFFFTTIMETNAYRAIEGVANARALLESGFTTIRDLGNAGNYADTDLRRAIEDGWVPGPTIINAGRIIAPYGGQFHLQPERRELGEPEYFYADTQDELEKAIRENIHYGARVIKLVADDQPYVYSVGDFELVVEEARRAGLKVAVHAGVRDGGNPHNAIAARVASIEHGFRISDEDLELMKKNDVVLVGTDFTAEAERDAPLPAGWHKLCVDRLRRAYRIGVTMAYGTDVAFRQPGETRGTLSIAEIESWVEAGIPAPVILKALTTNAARLLGVEKERGRIEPGLAADIIATRDNPLDNIQTLKKVTFVMKEGKVFKANP